MEIKNVKKMSHFGHISISAVKFHICCNKFSSSLDHQIQISSKPFRKPINFFGLLYIYIYLLRVVLSGQRREIRHESGTWPTSVASCVWHGGTFHS